MSFITKDDTVLVAIDFQEKLMPATSNGEETEERAAKLIRGMKVFDIPAIVTQQYTKGIGPTTAKFSAELGDFEHVEKTAFSAMRMPEFRERLKETGRKNVVICGVEAHICVLQTTLQLMEEGAVITTYESVLYEILQDSKADGFKAISAIVK